MRFPTFMILTEFVEELTHRTILRIRYKSQDHRVVVPSGVWYHLAIKIKNNNIVTYINGVEKLRNLYQSKDEVGVKKEVRVSNETSVCLDEFLISSSMKSSAEVKDIYNSYLSGESSLLVSLISECKGVVYFFKCISENSRTCLSLDAKKII